MRIHTLDPEDFKECKFFKTLEELKHSNFIYAPSEKIYNTLVKIFFSNLFQIDGILHSEVDKHPITLSIIELGKLLDLPHEDHLTKLDEKANSLSAATSSSDVRIAALAASINFVQCLSNPSDRDRFHIKIEMHLVISVGESKTNGNMTFDVRGGFLLLFFDNITIFLCKGNSGGNQMVQEGALTALASVADSSQEKFQKYYDAVTPYLKAILLNSNDKSNRMLRAKAMECISLVGMAVGKEKFRDDAKQVMDVLMSLQQSQLDADDPTASYMLQV
ncbi:hypothetical protein RYX36_010257 [Vicia faba]